MNKDIISAIKEIASEDAVFINEPMSKHTTFRIGGPAELFVKPDCLEKVVKIIDVCKKNSIPYQVMGNGSNMLVLDGGVEGVVISLTDNFSKISLDDDVFECEAGALLSKIGSEACRHSLTGFEFASGIPGTLGGACIMNAGAYGGEMKDVLISVTALQSDGQIKNFTPDEMDLSYRNSIFLKKNMIVLSAKIKLKKGNVQEISNLMKDLAARRRDKQPLEYPSAGSTFKRPEGFFAGKLIMDAGLSGFRVGDAAVSSKHCGFVINMGNATAKDVCELMKQVSQKVYDRYNVHLEPEVRIIGKNK